MADIGIGVLLLLVGAPPANSSLPLERGFGRIHGPAIWLAG